MSSNDAIVQLIAVTAERRIKRLVHRSGLGGCVGVVSLQKLRLLVLGLRILRFPFLFCDGFRRFRHRTADRHFEEAQGTDRAEDLAESEDVSVVANGRAFGERHASALLPAGCGALSCRCLFRTVILSKCRYNGLSKYVICTGVII